jgi:integrase
MENQMFLDFNLRFNLRQTKQNKPTIIYAVFVWQGVQYKVNTLLKVYPSQWDNKTQTATISNRLSKLDNHNNKIANQKITSIYSKFIDKKHYLCNKLEADIVKEISAIINPINKHRKMKSNKKKITDVLNDMAYQHQDKSLDQYLFSVKMLKKFLDKKGLDDDISILNGELLNNYQQSLVNEEKAIKTISAYIRNLKTLINYANKDKFLNIKIDITELEILKDKRTNEQKKSKQVPLSENQLMDIYNLRGLTEREEEARDLFICQSLLGQRISDMPKIFKGDYTTNLYEDGLETISFNVQKTNEEATLFLFPIAKEIIKKYRNKKFNHFNLFETDENKVRNSERMINTDLKKVCKKAGLTSEINYTVQIGDKVKSERKPLYLLMHTHIARHTFITLMCQMGIDKDVVIIATAHTDIKMINDVYLHETASDRGKKLIKSLQNNSHNSFLFNIGKSKYSDDLINILFAYDSFITIIDLMHSNNDVFHLDSTKHAIKTIKDISKLNSYSKDADISKVVDLEQVIFELSYYFRDPLLYSIFKHKEHYFGLKVDVPSTEEVEAMFALEDIERPKKQIQADIEAWENRNK